MRHLLIILLLFITTSALAIKPDTVYIRQPENLGLIYKTLEVKTNDNYQIATWFFPTQGEMGVASSPSDTKLPYQLKDKEPMPTIIICNGDAGNMSYFQLFLVNNFVSLGFNVVTFDWRAFGASSPFPMDSNYLCYTEMLEDYRAVIDEVAQQPEVDPKKIAIMGWSTGAYLSMIAAHNNPNVAAFIGRSLMTDFEDIIPLIMEKRGKTLDNVLIPADFPIDQTPVKIAKDFKKPIFLINGGKDFRTPVWMSEKVLSLLPESTPRQLVVIPEAAHGGMEDPILVDFVTFINNVIPFLEKHL